MQFGLYFPLDLGSSDVSVWESGSNIFVLCSMSLSLKKNASGIVWWLEGKVLHGSRLVTCVFTKHLCLYCLHPRPECFPARWETWPRCFCIWKLPPWLCSKARGRGRFLLESPQGWPSCVDSSAFLPYPPPSPSYWWHHFLCWEALETNYVLYAE